MTHKDNDDETISKSIADSLARISGILTALLALAGSVAAFIASVTSNDPIQQIAGMIATLFLIAAICLFAISYFQRKRKARLRFTESLEPLAASAALRGLLPFEEGDQLPGRRRDVQEIYTLVASSTFRFGVLWGESGCGKTSLLRAGLTPTLRKEKFLPLYVGKPTKEPREAIRAALIREAPDLDERIDDDLKQLLREVAPKGKKVVVLFDQFEEFFLTNRTLRSRASFIKWLGEVVAEEDFPVTFLIGIRADFFAQLQNLAPHIPNPTSPHSTHQLQNFDVEQAEQIFSAAAKADSISFEPELIEAVVNDLETEEFVRPAELQIVGTRLKRKNVLNLNRYEVLGRARGILSSYISDEIKQSMNEQAARLVLRLMCADAVEAKSPTDLSLDDILSGISGVEQGAGVIPSSQPEDIRAILNRFVDARIVIHTDDDKFNLVHDYLAPYIHTATEGMETNVERANRLLKRYIAEYKEYPKMRLSYRHVRWIQKYASADIQGGTKAQALIKKSKRAFYTGVGFYLAVPLLLLGFYLFQTSSYYFDTSGVSIAVHTGHWPMRFLPVFDHVVVETDFWYGDLNRQSANEFLDGQVTGFWFQQSKGGDPEWWEQLFARLSVVSQARALRWLGQTERAVEILRSAITYPQTDSSSISSSDAARALGQLAQINPRDITPEVVQSLRIILPNLQASPELRRSAAEALWQIGQANPQDVPPEVINDLRTIVHEPQADAYLRVEAVYALWRLDQTNPQVVMSDVVQSLKDILIDTQASSYLRYGAADALGRLAQANPQAITPELIDALHAIVTNPQADSYMRIDAAYALGQLSLAGSQALGAEVVDTLKAIIINRQADHSLRSHAMNTLGQLAQANPQIVTSEMIDALHAVLINSVGNNPTSTDDFNVVTDAANVLGQLAQANPQAVTSEMIDDTLRAIDTNQGDSYLNDKLAAALRQLVLASPQAMTPEAIVALRATATNPDTAPNLRFTFTDALGHLALTSPQAMTPEVIVALRATVTNPDAGFDLRISIADALVQLTYVDAQVATLQAMPDWIALLKNNIDKDGRTIAAYALFAIAIRDPLQERSILYELEKLRGDAEPQVRLAASKAIEMIAIGDSIQEARNHPEQIAHIKSKLNVLSNSDEEHLKIAAKVVLQEIAKIESSKK